MTDFKKKECCFCFGTGKRYIDIGDNNDVEVTCDDCRGTGYDLEIHPGDKKEVQNDRF